jgi:ferrous iron transport protein B
MIGRQREQRATDMSEQITIALAGNPNSGKTTIFNALTGSHQRIGNWPGVTVERKEGRFIPNPMERILADPFLPQQEGPAASVHVATGTGTASDAESTQYRVVDLPGIYSLAASSEDEAVARNYLLSADADLVVNVVDASNLQRNLFLTLQLLEMGLPVIVVLNMMDMAGKKGIEIDVDHVSSHLGCPVIACTAIRDRELSALRGEVHQRAVAAHRNAREHAGRSEWSGDRIHYPAAVERVLEQIVPQLEHLSELTRATPRWLALKLLEGDPWVTSRVAENSQLSYDAIDEITERLTRELGEELDIVLADAKYGFIHGLSRHITRRKVDRQSITERIDRVVMNRFAAIPIFLAAMYAVFWFTMSIGGAFIDFFDIAFGTVFVDGFASLLGTIGAPQWLIGILAGGIGAGIQTVATFVPIIFAMFLALALLEDSGYMARAAYVMDRFMRSIGLPGKSFVPMMVGFGCTVPAIMGTRTLDSKRDRFTTIFMSPNMSCGARLPVYALFAAAFFAGRSGAIVLSLYVAGIVVAVLTGLLLKLTMFRGEASHFVMELPPYHAPRVRFVLGQAWDRLRLFVIRAGITITVIVTILSAMNTLGTDGTIGNEDSPGSVLSAVGRAITPVFTPMGVEQDNWPATVGIFTGIFAKEAVVGTLSSLYIQGAGDDGEQDVDIGAGLLEAVSTIPANLSGVFGGLSDPLGLGVVGTEEAELAEEIGTEQTIFAVLRQNFSPAGAYAYLLFVLLYFPCVAAMAAAIREMGAPLGIVLGVYSTVLAWSVATLFYQLATTPQVTPVAVAVGLILLLIITFRILGNTRLARVAQDVAVSREPRA